jgi:hypothetical protein
MRRPRSKRSDVDEAIARMEAEDRIVGLLDDNHDIAAIQAVKLANITVSQWEVEMEAMRSRKDPRPVFLLAEHEHCQLDLAVARCSQEPQWHTCSVASLLDELVGLQPDEAALVSIRIVNWAYRRAGFK